VVFDLARYGQRSHKCQFRLRFDETRNGLLSLYSAASRLTRSGVTATPPSRVTATTSARRHAPGPRPRGDPWPRPQRQRWQACSRPLTIRTSVRANPWFRAARSAAAQLRTHSPAGARV